MKYDMIPKETVKRICDTFYNHSASVNEKYNKLLSEEGTQYSKSDRDRFVERFFKKYIGTYFAMIDKNIYAIKFNNCFSWIKPYSIFSCKQQDYIQGDYLYRTSKIYLYIQGFMAINEMYGIGYIKMMCIDIFGKQVDVKLDYDTLSKLQFMKIDKKEFDKLSRLFKDDREDRPFKVTRYLNEKEMKQRKPKRITSEIITVMAKDAEEAYKKTTNVVKVEIIA